MYIVDTTSVKNMLFFLVKLNFLWKQYFEFNQNEFKQFLQ